MISGRVGFEFFASPETDMLFANFAFSPGTPRERSEAMLAELARSLAVAEERLTDGAGGLVVEALADVLVVDALLVRHAPPGLSLRLAERETEFGAATQVTLGGRQGGKPGSSGWAFESAS